MRNSLLPGCRYNVLVPDLPLLLLGDSFKHLSATSSLHRFTAARQRETCARQLSHTGGDSARQRETARDSARQRETAARQPRILRESVQRTCCISLDVMRSEYAIELYPYYGTEPFQSSLNPRTWSAVRRASASYALAQ